jgi:hypothetical protein
MTDKLSSNNEKQLIDEINAEYGLELLFFSWKYFNHHPEGKSARITQVKDTGFVVETTCDKEQKKVDTYTFTSSDNSNDKGKYFLLLRSFLFSLLTFFLLFHFPRDSKAKDYCGDPLWYETS